MLLYSRLRAPSGVLSPGGPAADRMPFLRFSRDKRGYANTYLCHTFREDGIVRMRVLYWFRSPPDIAVGRPALDAEAVRDIEASNPDLTFDWEEILKAKPPAAPPDRGDHERRERRSRRRGRGASTGSGRAPAAGAETQERSPPAPAAAPDASDASPAGPGTGAEGPPGADTGTADAPAGRPGRRRRRRGRRGGGAGDERSAPAPAAAAQTPPVESDADPA